MKKLFLLLTWCFIVAATYSQTTIKGKIIDAANKEPLPYATITVTSEPATPKPIKKFAADENGHFSTTLQAGKYNLLFNFIGMNETSQKITVESGKKTMDLGEIVMLEGSTTLDEISVVAQRPLVKVEIDKLTYSAKEDPESSTSNVLDLLRKVPLVTVDGEDNIQLKGSSNFKIYINGKPSNMISNNPSQVLKSMPANSIKDVEVITDPGAKYDAEGVGGIINIVTDKRVDEGYSGSVGANGDTFGGYGANAYLSLKYGKFGFTGNGSYFYHNSPASNITLVREEMAPNPVNMLTQQGTQTNNGGGLFYNTSLSFEPDTLNLFNLSVGQFGGKFRSNLDQNAVSIGSRNYSYLLNNSSLSEFGSFNLSADYQRSFHKKGELLTLSYRFEKDPNNSELENQYSEVTGTDFYYPDGYKMRSINNAGGNEHTLQIDYTNPINSKHSIETGIKYIFRDNSSLGEHTIFNGEWHDDPSRKNDLEHTQKIFSGYAGYGLKAGKFGLKLGLRGENTNQKIHFMSAQNDTIVPSNFFDLVPSVALSYQLGMTQTLRGGYNLRISRPGIWYLNPYRDESNPTSISYGNPSLEAVETHNFNINYGSFSQKVNFNATLSYSFTKNSISRYIFVDDQGITNNTYRNIGRNNTVGLSGYVGWTPSTVVRMNLNGSVNYSNIQSTENANLKNSGFSGRVFGGVTFTLPQEIRLSANGGVFSRGVQLQTTQSAFYFYSFSVMKSFLNKKLDVSINATTPFNKFREMNSTTTGDGFIQKSSFQNPMRNFRLSLTYRFGDLKTSMKRVQRGITNDDVMQGDNNAQGGTAGTGGGSGS